MADRNFVSYICKEMRAGHSPEQIRAYLVNYGYQVPYVNAAIKQAQKQVQHERQEAIKKNKAFLEKLADYIKDMRKKGYDDFSIQNTLLRYGYNYNLVAQAFQTLSQTPSAATIIRHELSNKTLIAIAGIIVGLAGITFLILFLFSPGGDILLDHELSLKSERLRVGETLQYEHIFINHGSAKSFDITISCEIMNRENENIITKNSDTVKFRPSITWKSKIPLSAEPGDYEISCDTKYGPDFEKITSSSRIFRVTKDSDQPTCTDGIQNQEEEGIDCGGPCLIPCSTASCSDGIQNQEEEQVDCGGPFCEPCEEATCDDNILNQGESGIDCGGPCEPCETEESCNDGIRNQEEEDVDCGGPCEPCEEEYHYWDAEKEIKEIPPEQHWLGKRICEKIDKPEEMDNCFLLLSKHTNQSAYCDEIDGTQRNNCYYELTQFGVPNLCEKIDNKLYRQACKTLYNTDNSYDYIIS